MGWIQPFLLGRPGSEVQFQVNPGGMDITEGGVIIVQPNLAGDLTKAVVKASAPSFKINSNFLPILQRNQFVSLVGIQDTFLSFITRTDWQQIDELASVISTTQLALANTSAAKLSAVLTGLGFSTIIGVQTPFYVGNGAPYGNGTLGAAPRSTATPFNPGAITYNDATRVISFPNALPSTNMSVYVSYTYTGYLVNLKQADVKYMGGRLDLGSYDFMLEGA